MDSIPDLSPVNNGQLQPYSVNGTHPPYSDMIVAAIVALKDRDGSSRQAIAKYIERNYANLPPTHSNLLTHHLKRMKNLGLLMMVKHSYMLPPLRSVPFESETPSSTPTPTPKPSIDHNIADYPVTSTDTYATTTGSKPENSSARRKPGRPPKPRHEFGFQVQGQQPDKQPAHEFYQPHFDHNSGTGQDFQPQNPLGGSGDDLQSPYGSRQEFQAEPIFASLGLADDGVAPPLPTPSAKRGRGRPPKSSSASRPVVTSSEDGGGEVEPEKSEPRLNRGKSKLMSIMLFNGGGVKRGVGRPRRIGRPVTVPLSGNVMRKRGRPRRPSGYYAENVSDDGGGEGEGEGEGGSVSVSRGRGRPPKSSGGANKGPVLNSQIGWPNEGATGTSVLVTDPQQLVAFQELKSKYEHLQSRTREVMDVVRPYINSDYAAFGVLQELETLLETDANPPQQV